MSSHNPRGSSSPVRILVSPADISPPSGNNSSRGIRGEASSRPSTSHQRSPPSRESSFRRHARLAVSPQESSAFMSQEWPDRPPLVNTSEIASAPFTSPFTMSPTPEPELEDDDYAVEVEVFPHRVSPAPSAVPVATVPPVRASSDSTLPSPAPSPPLHVPTHTHHAPALTVPVPDYILSASGANSAIAAVSASPASTHAPSASESTSLSVWGRSMRLVRGMFARRTHTFTAADAYVAGWRVPFSLAALHVSADVAAARAVAVTCLRACLAGEGCAAACGYGHYCATFERVRGRWRELEGRLASVGAGGSGVRAVVPALQLSRTPSHPLQPSPRTTHHAHTNTDTAPHITVTSSTSTSTSTSTSSPQSPPFPLPPLLLSPPSLPLLLPGAGAVVAHTAFALHPGAPPAALHVPDLPLLCGAWGGEHSCGGGGAFMGVGLDSIRAGCGSGAHAQTRMQPSAQVSSHGHPVRRPPSRPPSRPRAAESTAMHSYAHTTTANTNMVSTAPAGVAVAGASPLSPSSTPPLAPSTASAPSSQAPLAASAFALPPAESFRYSRGVPWAHTLVARMCALALWSADAHARVYAHLIALHRVERALAAAEAEIDKTAADMAAVAEAHAEKEEWHARDSQEVVGAGVGEDEEGEQKSHTTHHTHTHHAHLIQARTPTSASAPLAARVSALLARALLCDCTQHAHDNTSTAVPSPSPAELLCPCALARGHAHARTHAQLHVNGDGQQSGHMHAGAQMQRWPSAADPPYNTSHSQPDSHTHTCPPVSASALAAVSAALSRGEALLAAHQLEAARRLVQTLILCTYRHHTAPMGALRLSGLMQLREAVRPHVPLSALSLPRLYELVAQKHSHVDGHPLPRSVRRLVASLHEGVRAQGGWLTSDSGWGCTLRSGQMVLANVLVRHFSPPVCAGEEVYEVSLTGTRTRLVLPASPPPPCFRPQTSNPLLMLPILHWLHDSPHAPYSLHALMMHADRPCGQWFAPGEVMVLLGRCVASAGAAAEWVNGRYEGRDDGASAHMTQVRWKSSPHTSNATAHARAEDPMTDADAGDGLRDSFISVPPGNPAEHHRRQRHGQRPKHGRSHGRSGGGGPLLVDPNALPPAAPASISPASPLQPLPPLAAAGASNLTIHVAVDGCVYLDDVRKAMRVDAQTCSSSTTSDSSPRAARSCLLAVPLRLGVDVIPAALHEHVTLCLRSRFSAGIVGGAPRSSYYFYGYQGSRLLYLDPHRSQPTQLVDLDVLRGGDTRNSYSCEEILSIEIGDLDPSLCVCYYVRDAAELDAWAREMSELARNLTLVHGGQGLASQWLFSVHEERPLWMRAMDEGEEGVDVGGLSDEDGVDVGGRGRQEAGARSAPGDDEDDDDDDYVDEWGWWPKTTSAATCGTTGISGGGVAAGEGVERAGDETAEGAEDVEGAVAETHATVPSTASPCPRVGPSTSAYTAATPPARSAAASAPASASASLLRSPSLVLVDAVAEAEAGEGVVVSAAEGELLSCDSDGDDDDSGQSGLVGEEDGDEEGEMAVEMGDADPSHEDIAALIAPPTARGAKRPRQKTTEPDFSRPQASHRGAGRAPCAEACSDAIVAPVTTAMTRTGASLSQRSYTRTRSTDVEEDMVEVSNAGDEVESVGSDDD